VRRLAGISRGGTKPFTADSVTLVTETTGQLTHSYKRGTNTTRTESEGQDDPPGATEHAPRFGQTLKNDMLN